MSRWGSLLQGAVAGIESRLDTILADDEQASAKSRAAEVTARQATTTPKLEKDLSRASSQSRTNARLQDRLAKAMVKGTEMPKSGSATPSDLPSRAVTPAVDVDIPLTSIESGASDGSRQAPRSTSDTAEVKDTTGDTAVNGDANDFVDSSRSLSVPATTTGAASSQDATPSRSSLDSIRSRPSIEIVPDISSSELDNQSTRPRSQSFYEAELNRLRQEQEQSSKERHEHLERIDALQAKLQYLAKSAAETARQVASETEAGSLDRRLAEKDEQIAQLMEEGQKLSKTEIKHLNIIKRLQAKIAEEEKNNASIKKRLAQAEKNAADATERIRRAEATGKQAEERMKQINRIERDIEALKAERDNASAVIADLRRQLAEANKRADEAERKAQTGAQESERKVVAALKEEIEDLRTQKKLLEDRTKAEVRDTKEEAARQQERAKTVEVELRGEIMNLESRLEVLRARTEEASSSATGNSQAHLLRQIETLQTQYALASENWQGIEGTLTSRVTALEKERDEIAKRESDVRRKAREVNSKSRRLEEELESMQDRARGFEQELQEQRGQVQKLQARLEQTEAVLANARADFDRQKQIWETELQQRIEEEKLKWRLEIPTPPMPDTQFLRESPSASFSHRKHSTPDGLGIYGRRSMNRTTSTDILSPVVTDRPSSRRTLTKPFHTPDVGTPSRIDSSPSLPNINGVGNVSASQTPSIHTIDADTDAPETSTSSPHRTVADLISVSTVGAGPSVQLVSSMSAAVRRLESDKAASREEMARLAAQRDEARAEVVSLMREVEEKRALDEKVERLEKELEEVNARYQTTLEMLGERSEEVEELRNDVLDLKKMYRELVESTVK